MNKIKALSLAILTGIALTGCNDILADNVNPDVAHNNTAELGLPPLIFFANQCVYDHSEYGVYLSQCLTTMGKDEKGSRSYKNGWGGFITMQRHPQWRRHFYDIGVNANELIENSRAIGSPNYELIGRTLILLSTQLTTDAFGDMPRSEAYTTNSPHYDTQASIYEWMFQEIEDLLVMYNEQGNAEGNHDIKHLDRLYQGDMNKWKGLVLAIKARLLLRNIPNIDTTPATLQKIIDAADAAIACWRENPAYGWFGNEPRYKFDGGSNAQNACWGPGDTRFDTWQSYANDLGSAVPSKFFVKDIMGICNPGSETKQGVWDRKLGYGADPRLALLFKPKEGPVSASNDSKAVMFRFLENNIGAGQTYKIDHYPNLYCGAYSAAGDAYHPLFTMEELYFIKAEAYYWKGTVADRTEACRLAKEATTNNIQRHLERYLADNGGMYPYTDSDPNTVGETWWPLYVNAFLENEDGKDGRIQVTKCENNGPGSVAGGEKFRYPFNESDYTLSDLMQQKYVAMYLQPEQWTDMRRYHFSNNRNNYGVGSANEIVYPTLRRPYNLYKPYYVDGLDPKQQENTWIQRINYDPETEEKYNAAELERLGAAMNYKWLVRRMNWSLPEGDAPETLTTEPNPNAAFYPF